MYFNVSQYLLVLYIWTANKPGKSGKTDYRTGLGLRGLFKYKYENSQGIPLVKETQPSEEKYHRI